MFEKIMNRIGYIKTTKTTQIEKQKEIYKDELQKWSQRLRLDSCCDVCGTKSHLTAHHLYPKRWYPELALHPDNGVVLCQYHHNEYHQHWSDTKNTSPVTYLHFKTIHIAKESQKIYKEMRTRVKEERRRESRESRESREIIQQRER